MLFYGFANHLPDSYTMIIGRLANKIRTWIYRHIFLECGKRVSTINRNIYFGNGIDVCIGDYSGIGANSVVIKDVPEYAVVGGNPAKITKTRK